MKLKSKLIGVICLFVLVLGLLIMGVWSAPNGSINLGGSLIFKAKEINAKVSGTVTGTAAAVYLPTLNFKMGASAEEQAELESGLEEWEDCNLQFDDEGTTISVIIDIENLATDRPLYASITDTVGAVANVTKTMTNLVSTINDTESTYAGDFLYLPASTGNRTSVASVELTLKITDLNKSLASDLIYGYEIELVHEVTAEDASEYGHLVFEYLNEADAASMAVNGEAGALGATIGIKPLMVRANYDNMPSGNLVIPDYVYFNEELCKVTVINELAFLDIEKFQNDDEAESVMDDLLALFNLAKKYSAKITSVTLPNTIQFIGPFAFGACYQLENINIPSYVTGIYDMAFAGTAISNITLPKRLEYLGYNAFALCSNLTSVTFEKFNDSLYYNDQFVACTNFTNLTIKSGEINTFFQGCPTITNLTIGEGVTSIADSAFDGCTALKNVIIEKYNSNYSGYAFWDTEKTENTTNITSLTINAGEIANFDDSDNPVPTMFTGCPTLETLVIGKNVTRIGMGAFAECVNLSNLTISYGVTEIGIYAFAMCEKLASVTIPNSVTTIEDGAFGATALTNLVIPNSVRTIGAMAFGQTPITQVTIGSGVRSIGSQAFAECSNLTTVIIDSPTIASRAAQTEENYDYLIENASTIYIKASIFSSGYTLGTYFDDVNELAENQIINGVEYKVYKKPVSTEIIGMLRYYYQTDDEGNRLAAVAIAGKDLTYGDITVPSTVVNTGDGQTYTVVYVMDYGFIDMLQLEKDINSGKVTVESEEDLIAVAPNYVPNITSVNLPNTIMGIGPYAFALLPVNTLTIPDSVIEIGEYALVLSQVQTVVIGDGVEYIANYAFNTNLSLTTITIGSSVASMGEFVFANNPLLTNVTIKEGVSEIGYGAFYGCENLSSITIPSTVTSIGDEAFSNCSLLTNVYIDSPTIACGFTNSDSYGSLIKNTEKVYIKASIFDGSFTLTGYLATNYLEHANTETINGTVYKVYEAVPVSEVFNKVKYTYDYTNQTATASMVDPDTTSGDVVVLGTVTNSVDGKAYTVTSVGGFGDVVYSNYAKMTSITLPDTIITINDYAFAKCGITSITIPSNVTSIGQSAFYNCRVLTGSLIIPNSVTSIGYAAFYNCSGLTSLTIGNGVTSIGNSAFANCTSLTDVTIGNGVTSFGTKIFEGVTLTNLTLGKCYTNNLGCTFAGTGTLTVLSGAWNNTSIHNNSTGLTQGFEKLVLGKDVTSASKGLNGDSFKYIEVDPENPILDSRNNCNAVIVTETNTLIFGCKNTVIPASVEIINSHAFYSAGLTGSLVIPDSVTTIKDAAFYNCSQLANVTIKKFPTTFGSQVFAGCSLLTVTIENGEIPASAFNGLSIKSVIVGDGVTSIGDSAFTGCTNLTDVTIGNGVTTFGSGIFSGVTLTNLTMGKCYTNSLNCSFTKTGTLTILSGAWNSMNMMGYRDKFIKLVLGKDVTSAINSITNNSFSYIEVASENPILDSRNNCNAVIITETNTLTMGCKNTVIPEGVVNINAQAFYSIVGLTSINIPSTVTSIATYAFDQCTQIATIYIDSATIASNIATKDIYKGLFTAIEKVYIKDALFVDGFTLGNYLAETFIQNQNSETVNGVLYRVYEKALESEVFGKLKYTYNYKNQTASVSMVDKTTTTGDIEILESVTNSIDGKAYTVTTIAAGAFGSDFSGSCRLTSVSIPSSVTTIGNSAFYKCGIVFNGLVIPSTVTSVGDYAYSGNTVVGSITIGNGTNFNYKAFYNLSDQLGIIQQDFTDLIIENGEFIIGRFNQPYYLGYINLKIGAGVTNVKPAGAVYSHTGIQTIEVDVENLVLDSRENCNAVIETETGKLLLGCNGTTSIPVGVEEIGENAFCSVNFTNLVLPEGLKVINSHAFTNCTSNTALTLPSTITEIKFGAFVAGDYISGYYLEFVDLVFPAGVTLEDGAFRGCRLINSITISDGTGFNYQGFTNASCPDNLIVQSGVLDLDEKDSSFAFQRFGFKNLTLGKDVTSVNYYCNINYDHGLETIIVDSQNPLLDSRNNCNAIIETATNKLLFGCNNTVIPNDVQIIGEYAFYHCSFASIVIPNSVTTIEKNAFSYCRNLTTITIGNGVTSIGDDAFSYCSSLTKITIPSGVTSIGEDTFFGCSSLTEIIIPLSVTSIGDYAFYNCGKLKTVYYTGSEAQWIAITIGGSNGKLTSATKVYNYIPSEEE